MPRSKRVLAERAMTSESDVPMESRPHALDVSARQTAIYRGMTPARRLELAFAMHDEMRALMDAGLRAEHPELSDEERRQVIAQRILHARTG